MTKDNYRQYKATVSLVGQTRIQSLFTGLKTMTDYQTSVSRRVWEWDWIKWDRTAFLAALLICVDLFVNLCDIHKLAQLKPTNLEGKCRVVNMRYGVSKSVI